MANQGYFFDLDGTLVNTHESNTLAYIQAIEDVTAKPFEARDRLKISIIEGKSYKEFLPELLFNLNNNDVERISKRKAEIYPQFLDRSLLNTDLVSEIEQMKKMDNTVIALVTTAKRTNALSVLRFHNITHLFDVCVFGDDVDKPKPNPEIYLKALKIIGIDPTNVRAFEDSTSGIIAAQNAGIEVLRVDW